MGIGSSKLSKQAEILQHLNNKKWIIVAYDIKKFLAYISSPCIAFNPETCNKSHKNSSKLSENSENLNELRIYLPMLLIDVKNNYYIHPQIKKKFTIEIVNNNLIIKMHDIPGGGIQELYKTHNNKTVIEWKIKNNKNYENIKVYWIEQSKYTEIMEKSSKEKNICTNKCSQEFSDDFTKNIVDQLKPDDNLTTHGPETVVEKAPESQVPLSKEVPSNNTTSGGSLRRIKYSKKKKSKKVRSEKRKEKEKIREKRNKCI